MPEIYHSKAEPVAGKPHLFIAMPVGRPMEAAMLDFFWQVRGDLDAKGVPADLYLLANHCHVDDARNLCVYEAMKRPFTHFLFVDSDNCTSADAVGELLELDRDVICGAYPYKDDTKEHYPVRRLAGARRESDGCIEADRIPTGFMMLKREVLEAAVAASTRYFTKEVKKGTDDGIPLLFERGLDELHDRWGGDFNFCRKIRALGYKLFIYPPLWFRHYGTKAYTGNLANYLAREEGEMPLAFDKAILQIRNRGSLLTPCFMRLEIDWMNNWSMLADSLQALYWLGCEVDRPILELGSGLSTLVLGLAAEKAGVRVWSFEHDPGYYQQTAKLLKRYDLRSVRLLYAPLKNYGDCLWYTLPELMPRDFGLAVVDGPPRRFGRNGVFKYLGKAIENAKIVMDDMDEEEALSEFKAWCEKNNRKVHVFGGADAQHRPLVVSEPRRDRGPVVSEGVLETHVARSSGNGTAA